jgi:uncharacterized protein
VRFWDASALFALVAVEPSAAVLRRAMEEDPWGIAWFFTPVEIRSALARRRRAGEIEADVCEAAWTRLETLRLRFSEVDSFRPVRERAQRLLDLHALRAADALQLAAAIVSAEGRPTTLPFVTLDGRLAEAARKEGFRVLPPLTGESLLAESTARLATGGRRRGRGSDARSRVRVPS